MRIAAAEVQLAARHHALVKEEEHASLRVSVGANATEQARAAQGPTRDRVGISALAQAQAAVAREAVTAAAEECAANAAALETAGDAEDTSEDPKLKLFRLVIEALTGAKIRAANLDIAGASDCTETETSTPSPERARQTANERPAGFSLEYDYKREYHETEHTSVAARGVVTTTDGKQIEFAVQVAMQRAYHESTTESVRMGDAAKLKDPLFLHFEGEASQLQQGTFAFDLDADGSLENIHFAPPSSAALALDHNGNGKIDDGNELFGTKSGDGFADLARHDADGNGWIDEADPVFHELRLWSRSADGQSRLSKLGERGVGAIYLGRVSSPYQIKDAANRLQGVVRSTGVWLGEDGTAGAAQQIDLAV